MRRGGRGRSGGFGPNLSWSCRWFPGMPRGWWRSPYAYGYGTPYGYRSPYGYPYF